jgi:hypothetical protein
MNTQDSRRNFIKTASIGTVAALTLPQIVSAAFSAESFKKVKRRRYPFPGRFYYRLGPRP